MKKHVLVAIMAVASSEAALAQTQLCDAFVGQTVKPSSFDAVATALKRVPAAKGEYETTAAYEARLAAAGGSSPAQAIIGYVFDAEHLKYDADAGALNVIAYALQNINTQYDPVFGYGTPYYGKVEFNSFNNDDLVVSQTETPTGTYVGQNAYGAKVTVQKLRRVIKTIFQGEGNSGQTLWPLADKNAKLGSVPMSVEQAKSLEATGKAAVVLRPKWPFYAEGTKNWDPSITSRTDVTNPIHVIVADLQCGLLLTGDDKVVAAFPTQ